MKIFYILFGLGIGFFLFKRFIVTRLNLKELVNRGARVIDVRTPEEYAQGHVEGSENIPLNKLADHIEELKTMNRPIITCCASGMRSGQAAMVLKKAGISAVNGGSWKQVRNQLIK